MRGFKEGDRVLVSLGLEPQKEATFIAYDPYSNFKFIARVDGMEWARGWATCVPLDDENPLDGIKIGHPMVVKFIDGSEVIKIYCGKNKYGQALFPDNFSKIKGVYDSYRKLSNYDYTQPPEVLHGKFYL